MKPAVGNGNYKSSGLIWTIFPSTEITNGVFVFLWEAITSWFKLLKLEIILLASSLLTYCISICFSLICSICENLKLIIDFDKVFQLSNPTWIQSYQKLVIRLLKVYKYLPNQIRLYHPIISMNPTLPLQIHSLFVGST